MSKQPAEAVRLAKKAGYDLIKFWSAPTGVELDSILAAARQVGLPIAGHPPGRDDNRRAIEMGYVSVEHLMGLGSFDGAEVADDSVRAIGLALKQAGVYVYPTLFHVKTMFGMKGAFKEPWPLPEVRFSKQKLDKPAEPTDEQVGQGQSV